MEYAKGYPCDYGMEGGGAIKVNGTYVETEKNGSSWHIANRKSAAITYFPNKPKYTYVLILDPNSFKNEDELYALDADFVEFVKAKGLGEYYINEGGGTEWFLKSCPISYLELRKEFLKCIGIPIIAVIENDPYPIHDLKEEDKRADEEEQRKIRKTKQSMSVSFEKFCRIFLPGKLTRRIQFELWYVFKKICESPDPLKYKGIIQWPTGVGKTIGTLILIVLAFERCKSRGEFYRGMFVSPKNDILNTISQHFTKLSEFGITVYDGSNGKLSSLSIPTESHVLVYACQAALTNNEGMRKLPKITHFHYDEVHRITGEIFFELLKEMLEEWKTEFLTGTSATPQTSSESQRSKLSEIFGIPYTIIHRCDVDEAVQEGWIARPRFMTSVIQKYDARTDQLNAYMYSVNKMIQKRKDYHLWKDGKIICYISNSIQDVIYCIEFAREFIPGARVYGAVDGYRSDEEFIKSSCDGTIQILFACQRFREGSDIPGLEMVSALVGNTTAAYIMVQISGRALRSDYANKEGWCHIVRPCVNGITEQDIYDSILLDIFEFLNTTNKKYERKEIERLVRTYLGEDDSIDYMSSVTETIQRLQAIYVRKEYLKRIHKEQYSLICGINKEMGISSKQEYLERASEHIKFIDKPDEYFKDWWVSWYHFLGVDTSAFPQTKPEWIRVCKEMALASWDAYKQKNSPLLPANPGEMYEDYTNWDKEFGVEEDMVW